jgi:hypothetical protein
MYLSLYYSIMTTESFARSFAQLYAKLYSTPEFQDFNTNINDTTPSEIARRYFRNKLSVLYDLTVLTLINKPEYTNIFTNTYTTKNIGRKYQTKLFLEKLIDKLFTKEKVSMTLNMPFFELSMDKKEFSKKMIESMDHVDEKTWAKINSVRDAYTLFLDLYAKLCTTTVYNDLNKNGFSNTQIDDIRKSVLQHASQFNEIYEHESTLINHDLFDEEHSSQECEEGEESDKGDGENEEGDDCDDCESDEEPTPVICPKPLMVPVQPNKPPHIPQKSLPQIPVNQTNKRTYDQITQSYIIPGNPNKKLKK